MKWKIINGEYDGANNILLYCRNEKSEKKVIKVVGFEPYFYVPSGEVVEDFNIISQNPAGVKSIYGDELDKVITRQPRNVGDIRDKFSKHFEADILFCRRFLIDSNIFSAFSISDGRSMIQWDRIKPDQLDIEPRYCFLDIETYSKGKRYPKATARDAKVTIICFYDSYSDTYLSIAVDPKPRRVREVLELSKSHKVIIVPHERDLLELTKNFFDVVSPDITSAWYLEYDKNYLDERLKIVKSMSLPWPSTNDFDLLAGYKTLYAKGSNALADVVISEKLNVPNYEPFQHEFWEGDLKKAILVNKSHVEAIKMLNDKLSLLSFYWNLKNLVGFESMGPALYHGMLVENMALRSYHNKYILPSKPNDEERERRKALKESTGASGGAVLDPPFGIFENVAVLDMSRYYVELLIAQNLSPEPHKEDELGIFPKIALDLVEARLDYDRKLGKLTPGTEEYKHMKFQRDSIKFVTESIIGSFGSEGSRVFDLDIFNKVTKMGQRGMSFVQKTCNKDGNRVIYFDTDGASVIVPDVEYAKKYVKKLNDSLKKFSQEEGIARELSLKLDRYFSKIIFKKLTERVDGKWVERGAKKRYAGRVIWENGKDVDYLKIVGFEYVRRDSSKISKEIQRNVFDLMLKAGKAEIKEYLLKEIKRIKDGYADGTITAEDLAIPKTLSKGLDSYGRESKGRIIAIPDYARGAIYCNKWFGSDIRGDDQVKMIYVKKIEGYPPTDVISCLSFDSLPVKIEVDLEKMIERSLQGSLEDVIDLIGLKWEEIARPHKSLLEVLK